MKKLILNDEILFCILWCLLGLILYWLAILIKQIVYIKRNKVVPTMFCALENKKDWLDALFISFWAMWGGILNLYFIYLSIDDICYLNKYY